MKVSKRITSAFLATIMLFSVWSVGFSQTPVAATVVTPESSGLKPIVLEPIERPIVNFYCTEVTRVASAAGSTEPGMTIVKATPSGVPELSGAYASQAYAGETPAATRITFETTATGISIKKISSSNNTVTFNPIQYSPPGKYYVDVKSGMAEVGEAITFTVDYTWTDGRTYQEKCVTYVESIVTGGSYAEMEYTWKPYYGNSSWYRGKASISTRILGEGVYYEQPLDTMSQTSYGIYNVATGGITINTATNYDTAIHSISEDDSAAFFDDPRDDRRYDQFIPGTPITHVYIDQSKTTTLSDINLRLDMNVGCDSADKHSNDWDQATALLDSYVYTGLVKSNPGTYTNNEDAANLLGYTLPGKIARGCKQPASDLHGEQDIATVTKGGNVYENIGTFNFKGAVSNFSEGDSFTIINRYYRYFRASAAHVTITPTVPMNIVFHFVDKGELKEMIDFVMGSDPTSPLIRNAQKGTNPQAWYYKSGFQTFQNAYTEALRVYNNPQATATKIGDAVRSLKTAYNSLVLDGADYTEVNELLPLAEEIVEKADCYPSIYVERVQEAIDMVKKGYNILYQTAVDTMAENLKYAIDNVVAYAGDYTAVRSAIARFEELDGAYYTTESWRAVKDAIAMVEYGLDATKQDEIDAYAKAINDAIDNLVSYLADFSKLQEYVDKAKSINKSHYINAALLTTPLNNAQTAIDDHAQNPWKLERQSEVDALADALKKRLDGLILRSANFTNLKTAVEKTIMGNPLYYDAVVLEEYNQLVAEGQEIINTSGLTILDQEMINAKTKEITDKYNELLATYDVPVDTSALEIALEKAALIDKNDYVNDEAFANFEKAVQEGKELLAGNLTEDSGDEIEAAAKKIEDALLAITPNGADLSSVYAVSGKLSSISMQKTDVVTYVDGNLGSVQLAKYQKSDIDAIQAKITEFINAKDYTTEDEQEISDFVSEINIDIASLRPTSYHMYLDEATAEYEDADSSCATTATWLDYQEAYYNAIALISDAPQDEINMALTNLIDAKSRLELKAADKTLLKSALDEASKVNTDIYENSALLEEFEAAVAEGTEIYEDDTLTAFNQKKIDSSAQRIIDAINALVSGGLTPENLFNYLDTIEDETLDVVTYDTIVLGSEKRAKYNANEIQKIKAEIEAFNGTYNPESVKAFVTEITEKINALKVYSYDEYLKVAIDEYELMDLEEFADKPDAVKAYTDAYETAKLIDKNADQSEINKALINLVDARKRLTDDAYFKAMDGTETVVDKEKGYIYGIGESLNNLNGYIDYDGGEVEYILTQNGFGTGTVVNFVVNGVVEESFTVLIYGDITGDGVVDSFDYSVMPAIVNGDFEASEVVGLAADINFDGVVDTFDVTVLGAVTVGVAEIDQTKKI